MADRSYGGAVVLAVCTAAVFAPALSRDLVMLDLPAAPVTVVTSPGGNVVLHALNAALVLLLLARLTGRLVPSALAAALFALHPLRVESIFWIEPGHEVCGMTAALVTVLVYAAWVRRGGAWRYVVAVMAYAVAVAATPLMAPLPVVLLLLDGWPLGRLDVAAPGKDPRLARRLAEKLPFALLAGVAIARTLEWPSDLMLGASVANAFVAVVRYLGLLFLPVGLTPFRPATPPPWWAPGAALAIIATTAGILAARTRAPALTVGWLWFLIALVPVLGEPPADRFTALPSLGLLIVIAWSGGALANADRRAVGMAMLVAISVGAVATRRQLTHWHDDEAVLRHALAVTEDNFTAERSLGRLLVARGAWDEAAIHAAEAVRLRPDDPEARNDLGEGLLRDGHVDAAAEHFAAAFAARPDLPRFGYNLGRAEQQRGRLDEAIAAYRAVLTGTPDDAGTHASLARALRQRGRLDEARDHFERALALGASPVDVLGPLAQTFAEAGDLDGAAERYRALLALTPDDATAHHRLGTLAARRGDLALAEAEYRTALRLRPDLAEAQLHLGIVLAARGALAEAMVAYDAALALAPRLPSAHYNRAVALEATGDREGARAALRAEIDLQPNWPPALLRLATLLAGNGDDGRAAAGRLVERAAAGLGDDDPEVEAVRRLLGQPSTRADSP